MALTAEEIRRIEEEELLRFKTRRTLEVCAAYRFTNARSYYRSPGAASNIRCLSFGLLCAAAVYIFFPEEASRSILPGLAVFYAGLLASFVVNMHHIAEKKTWGAPLEIASPKVMLCDTILSASMFALGPIFWLRGREYESFGQYFPYSSGHVACCG